KQKDESYRLHASWRAVPGNGLRWASERKYTDVQMANQVFGRILKLPRPTLTHFPNCPILPNGLKTPLFCRAHFHVPRHRARPCHLLPPGGQSGEARRGGVGAAFGGAEERLV